LGAAGAPRATQREALQYTARLAPPEKSWEIEIANMAPPEKIPGCFSGSRFRVLLELPSRSFMFYKLLTVCTTSNFVKETQIKPEKESPKNTREFFRAGPNLQFQFPSTN